MVTTVGNAAGDPHPVGRHVMGRAGTTGSDGRGRRVGAARAARTGTKIDGYDSPGWPKKSELSNNRQRPGTAD
ncbi:hypothetical protein GCM10027605_07480 [Micromonospora zhanjiangensis]